MQDLDKLFDLINQGRNGQNKGLSVKLSKLDKLLGGIQPSRYYCISGASSSGKSALVLYWIYRILKDYPEDPNYFIYFNLELSAEVLLAKLMSMYCAEEFGVYLSLNRILSFDELLTDLEYNYLLQAREWISKFTGKLFIIDTNLSHISLYKETISILHSIGKLDKTGGKSVYIPNNPKQKVFGVVDHMALLQPQNGNTLKTEIDISSAYMITLKRKYHISWFVLMQQNRESSSMDRRKADLSEPGLNDVRDSSGPTNDADVVLQIFYPSREKLPTYRGYDVLGPNGLKSMLRSIIVTKNRYGIADKVVPCTFYGIVGWWKELPEPDQMESIENYRNLDKNIYSKYIEDKNITDSNIKDENQQDQISFNFSL